MAKRVLIITYYWPPAGGPGVQRPLKFVKYLREFGWEPIIYTASNPTFPKTDLHLEKEIPEGITILKQPIWEPYSFYKKFKGKGTELKINHTAKSEKPGLKEKISVFIRGNFFVPDARKFWVKPSIRFLTDWIKKNPVDIILTTSPPQSLHLIGLGLHERLNLPWFADFRDPWTDIHYFEELYLMPFARKLHFKQQQRVLQQASEVITVGNSMAQTLRKHVDRNIQVIRNGHDIPQVSDSIQRDEHFVLLHLGTLMGARNPKSLWKALAEWVKDTPELKEHFKVRLIGDVDFEVKEEVAKYGLTSMVEYKPFMPHKEALQEMHRAWALLLLTEDFHASEYILPSKLFEYMTAQRPIICIGKQGTETAQLIKYNEVGYVLGFEEKEKIKQVLQDLYRRYQAGEIPSHRASVEQFSRRERTRELAALMNGYA